MQRRHDSSPSFVDGVGVGAGGATDHLSGRQSAQGCCRRTDASVTHYTNPATTPRPTRPFALSPTARRDVRKLRGSGTRKKRGRRAAEPEGGEGNGAAELFYFLVSPQLRSSGPRTAIRGKKRWRRVCDEGMGRRETTTRDERQGGLPVAQRRKVAPVRRKYLQGRGP